ncbi:hypothetical protein CkaCkLH20_04936 [Colletotrichum karsti]|uniref:Uncharacterized protein n=1 Tax=Colletotrichum karsti TaxID=1095194 RepID=A0A9P6LM40_9PEZI|nr:uncharacterized protein CkaCkLH20_04936 [Colletotrichum karsti]KAF9877801.1 hypothetical protein CkaCkLH20_04936 [Colletotrichum karsti]
MPDVRSDSGLGLRFLDLNDHEDDNSPCKGLRRLRSHDRPVRLPAPASAPVPSTPHAATPQASSPQASSPSLPSTLSFRGFSPLSPPRKQFSTVGQQFSTPVAKSPLARSWTEDDLTASVHSDENATQTTRDTLGLVQRLNELAEKLLSGEDVPDTNVSAMHGKLDEIESVMTGEVHVSQETPQGKPKTWPAVEQIEQEEQEHESLWTSPSPSWFRSGLSDISPSCRSSFRRDTPTPEPTIEKKPAVDTFRIASEAAKLNIELETLVTNLKARQEESEHIHQLLVTRAERAAQRIIFLQSRVQNLEEELQENDSELTYLRLGLKAIEVQCPADIDSDLAQSIQNWKADWTALKRKRAKHKSFDRSAYSTPVGTPIRPAR